MSIWLSFGLGLALDILAIIGEAAGSMNYPGGKAGSGMAQRIINLMPPHLTYIEPFGGSAAVARLKREAFDNFVFELDPLALDRARAAAGAARQLWRGERSRDRISPAAASAPGPDASPGSTILESRHKQRGRPVWFWILGDGLRFLETYEFDGSELVYADPPYVFESRRSARPIYEHEFDPLQHQRLLRWAIATRARVILSGYPSELYERALGAWSSQSFQAMTRGGVATEVIWTNFAPGPELHDDRFLGDGFRERERIKRKQARWVNRLAKMPAAERLALRGAIVELGGVVG
jgi:DNA adenine methylase